jgi:hypothetical protein
MFSEVSALEHLFSFPAVSIDVQYENAGNVHE